MLLCCLQGIVTAFFFVQGVIVLEAGGYVWKDREVKTEKAWVRGSRGSRSYVNRFSRTP